MASIQSIDRNTSADQAMAILESDGVVIYRNLLDDEVMDRVQSELDTYIAVQGRTLIFTCIERLPLPLL